MEVMAGSGNPLECPICYEYYNAENFVPTTFPCGHSCCLRHCTTERLENCPVCREKIPEVLTVSVALRDIAVALRPRNEIPAPPAQQPETKTKPVCKNFNSVKGCPRGVGCRFMHVIVAEGTLDNPIKTRPQIVFENGLNGSSLAYSNKYRYNGFFHPNGRDRAEQVPMRWMWSAESNCTTISLHAINHTRVENEMPYCATYVKYEKGDRVNIKNPHTQLAWKVTGRVMVPLKLGEEFTGDWECYIVDTGREETWDVIIGEDFAKRTGAKFEAGEVLKGLLTAKQRKEMLSDSQSARAAHQTAHSSRSIAPPNSSQNTANRSVYDVLNSDSDSENESRPNQSSEATNAEIPVEILRSFEELKLLHSKLLADDNSGVKADIVLGKGAQTLQLIRSYCEIMPTALRSLQEKRNECERMLLSAETKRIALQRMSAPALSLSPASSSSASMQPDQKPVPIQAAATKAVQQRSPTLQAPASMLSIPAPIKGGTTATIPLNTNTVAVTLTSVSSNAGVQQTTEQGNAAVKLSTVSPVGALQTNTSAQNAATARSEGHSHVARPLDKYGSYDSLFYHIEFPEFRCTCPVCCKDARHLRCSKCAMVYYCSRECQLRNWNFHKAGCNALSRAMKIYQFEYEKMLHYRDWEGRIVSAFEYYKFEFWRMHETRDYCRAVYDRIEACRSIGSCQAIQDATKQALQLLYHNRRDNFGLQCEIPFLFMILELDQEAHDFLKWFCECADDYYEADNVSKPFLSYWNCDRSAPLNNRKDDFRHLIAEYFLKFRLLMELNGYLPFMKFLNGTHPRAGRNCKHFSCIPFHRREPSVVENQLYPLLERIYATEDGPLVLEALLDPKNFFSKMDNELFNHRIIHRFLNCSAQVVFETRDALGYIKYYLQNKN